MIQNKKKKQNNGFSVLISKVILPCTAGSGESLKRILEKHRKRTILKPTIKPSTILSSGKDIVPVSKCQGVVCEIPRGECEHKYIGHTQRSLSTRLKEYHWDTLLKVFFKSRKKQL